MYVCNKTVSKVHLYINPEETKIMQFCWNWSTRSSMEILLSEIVLKVERKISGKWSWVCIARPDHKNCISQSNSFKHDRMWVDFCSHFKFQIICYLAHFEQVVMSNVRFHMDPTYDTSNEFSSSVTLRSAACNYLASRSSVDSNHILLLSTTARQSLASDTQTSN